MHLDPEGFTVPSTSPKLHARRKLRFSNHESQALGADEGEDAAEPPADPGGGWEVDSHSGGGLTGTLGPRRLRPGGVGFQSLADSDIIDEATELPSAHRVPEDGSDAVAGSEPSHHGTGRIPPWHRRDTGRSHATVVACHRAVGGSSSSASAGLGAGASDGAVTAQGEHSPASGAGCGGCSLKQWPSSAGGCASPERAQHLRWQIAWDDVILGTLVGDGQSGGVYRATWHGLDVAVKVFSGGHVSDDALREFHSEVGIMESLRHPNVVLFLGAVEAPPRLAIVSEFMPRGSLLRVLRRATTKQLPLLRRLRMALDAARGVHYLHSCSPPIVHHDLKSANLLVDKNWNVKVADFGLSKLKHTAQMSAKSGRGTPQWMAPEVLRSESSGEKSDVFSFGVILWELATGQVPWEGLNVMQVVGAVGFMGQRLTIPDDVDGDVRDLIQRCWLSDPEQRPTFKEIMASIEQIISQRSIKQQ